MTPQLALTLIGAAVGVYGAVLATVHFVKQRRDAGPQIKVSIFEVIDTGLAPDPAGRFVFLEAQNHGVVPVHLSRFALFVVLSDGALLECDWKYAKRPDLNKPLEPSQAVCAFIPAEQIVSAVPYIARRDRLRLRARYWDQVGRSYISEPYWFALQGPSKPTN